jgi:SpoVK/Ycf46/Vps4 family AAA+-type ATPase
MYLYKHDFKYNYYYFRKTKSNSYNNKITPKLHNTQELGISPARGLLLYGKPGCGKSLIASVIGQMLSPFRPITVISGPEILDKFVGSSEKNLRNVFDNPPDIYPKYRSNKSRRHDNNSDDDDYFGAGSTYTDDSDDDDVNNDDEDNVIANAALHVIVMDEFDAVARSRGGSDGKGGQGDAGVA